MALGLVRRASDRAKYADQSVCDCLCGWKRFRFGSRQGGARPTMGTGGASAFFGQGGLPMIKGSEPKSVLGARREILPEVVREVTENRCGSKREWRAIHDESSLGRGRRWRISSSRNQPHRGHRGGHGVVGAYRRSGGIVAAPSAVTLPNCGQSRNHRSESRDFGGRGGRVSRADPSLDFKRLAVQWFHNCLLIGRSREQRQATAAFGVVVRASAAAALVWHVARERLRRTASRELSVAATGLRHNRALHGAA